MPLLIEIADPNQKAVMSGGIPLDSWSEQLCEASQRSARLWRITGISGCKT